MAELFGTYDQKLDWKSIKEQFRSFHNSVDVNLTTLKEISNAIYCISKHTVFHPMQGIIFVDEGPKRYRPILSRVKEKTKDQIDCDVMFVEKSGGQLQNIRKPAEALLTAIRMAVRIGGKLFDHSPRTFGRRRVLILVSCGPIYKHASIMFFWRQAFVEISQRKILWTRSMLQIRKGF